MAQRPNVNNTNDLIIDIITNIINIVIYRCT